MLRTPRESQSSRDSWRKSTSSNARTRDDRRETMDGWQPSSQDAAKPATASPSGLFCRRLATSARPMPAPTGSFAGDHLLVVPAHHPPRDEALLRGLASVSLRLRCRKLTRVSTRFMRIGHPTPPRSIRRPVGQACHHLPQSHSQQVLGSRPTGCSDGRRIMCWPDRPSTRPCCRTHG
jgi:hypothetical protein